MQSKDIATLCSEIVSAFETDFIATNNWAGPLNLRYKNEWFGNEKGLFASYLEMADKHDDFRVDINLEFPANMINVKMSLCKVVMPPSEPANAGLYGLTQCKTVESQDFTWQTSKHEALPREIVRVAYEMIDRHFRDDNDSGFDPSPEPQPSPAELVHA